jgi:hypothetical protein
MCWALEHHLARLKALGLAAVRDLLIDTSCRDDEHSAVPNPRTTLFEVSFLMFALFDAFDIPEQSSPPTHQGRRALPERELMGLLLAWSGFGAAAEAAAASAAASTALALEFFVAV